MAALFIANYAAFRADLKKAMGSTKEATAAMKAAGVPVLAEAQSYAPRASGALAGSGRILAGSNKGRVVFRQAYAPGAEFGSHGRWKGFDKWGSTPRYGWRALNETADQVLEIVTRELLPVMTAYGWFS